MTDKEELEAFYSREDPWDYETTPDDIRRKRYILHALDLFGPFNRMLDIGCGQAWVTRDVHACVRHGLEISDTAAERFPVTVKRVTFPDGKYDLVMATGVLYAHYAWSEFIDMIRGHASRYILTCNIKSWEVPAAQALGKQIWDMEFPYRQWVQKLRVFEI